MFEAFTKNSYFLSLEMSDEPFKRLIKPFNSFKNLEAEFSLSSFIDNISVLM